MRKLILCALLAPCLAALPAHAVTIDFELLTSGCPGSQTSPLTTQGFTFQAGGDASAVDTCDSTDPSGASNGSIWLFAASSEGAAIHAIAMTEGSSVEAGLPFSLIAFDAAEFAVASPGGAIRVGAMDTAGNIVADHTFVFDGVIDGPGGEEDFESFVLPAGFGNVSSVVFLGVSLNSSSDFFAIDNIVAVVIPEPGTAVLLGFGLLGLLAVGRRRRLP